MAATTRALDDLNGLTLSPREAVVAVLVASVSADGVLRGEEADRFMEMLRATRWIESGREPIGRMTTRTLDLIARHGRATVLTACAAAIPRELRATALALATDLTLADGRLESRESTMLDELQRALGVADDLARKIIEVLLIKNRASGRPDF